VLAGVGVSWYQWLEQGRDITVSPQVLDAVARVLKLSGAERRHLYVLAGLNPPLERAVGPELPIGDGLQRLLDGWLPKPANIINRYWDNVAWNHTARELFLYDQSCTNCMVNYFTNELFRGRVSDWEATAARSVAEYRAEAALYPQDAGFAAVVDELIGSSREFAELWARQEVRPAGQTIKEVAHPRVGRVVVESTKLRMPERPDLTIVLHNPVPGTESAAKLEWLASPDGRRGGLRSVAAG
jgi:hypothetical protein